jgi:hypothetical protein
VNFDNETETYTIKPNSEDYSGKTYRFNVVLQEENSDVMVTSETIKIIMGGEDNTSVTEREKATITVDVDRDSSGFLNFSTAVNTTWVYENWEEKLHFWLKDTTHETSNLTDFILYEPISDESIPFQATFHEPYLLGLLNKKRDYLMIELEDAEMIILDANSEELKSNTASGSIPMQFDMRNQRMKDLRQMAVIIYWVGMGVVFFQFFALLYRNVSFLPLWTLIEYMQLVAFMPLYNFKLIPYLYDAFKPFLISHMILFDSFSLYEEFNSDFFNVNYLNYNLSINKLLQSLINITILFVFVVLIHVALLVVSLVTKGAGKTGDWVDKKLRQFRFNVYIRFYMLAFFDLTFFSSMKIWEGDNSSQMRKIALIFSYVFLTASVVAPICFFTLVMVKFKNLQNKEDKASYNTLVLKIDKNKRWRVANIGFFFGRRIAIAILLCLPVTNKYIFLQYVFVLMTSHIQILFLVAVKPYQSPLINMFVLANETFYSTLVIMVFIFSDATPQIPIKVVAGYILMTSIFLLLVANLAFIIYCMWKGKAAMKDDIDKAMKKRAEQEAKEEEEERKRKEEEEKEDFDKINGEGQQPDLDGKAGAGAATAGAAGAGYDDSSDLGKKKKLKHNQDDVAEMDGDMPEDGEKKKKKKKKKMAKQTPAPEQTKQHSSQEGSGDNGPGQPQNLRGSKTSGGPNEESDSQGSRVLK